MKKLIIILLMALTATLVIPSVINEAKAQIVTTLSPTAVNDTLTNTDTAWVYISTSGGSVTTGIADNISRSVTLRVIEVSGTTAGTITFQGTVDGTNWQTIDTVITLTNVADQAWTVDMRSASGSLIFKQYRAVFIMSGTQVVVPKVYYLRRSN